MSGKLKAQQIDQLTGTMRTVFDLAPDGAECTIHDLTVRLDDAGKHMSRSSVEMICRDLIGRSFFTKVKDKPLTFKRRAVRSPAPAAPESQDCDTTDSEVAMPTIEDELLSACTRAVDRIKALEQQLAVARERADSGVTEEELAELRAKAAKYDVIQGALQ